MAAQSWGCTRTLPSILGGKKVILQVVATFSNQWIYWSMNDFPDKTWFTLCQNVTVGTLYSSGLMFKVLTFYKHRF